MWGKIVFCVWLFFGRNQDQGVPETNSFLRRASFLLCPESAWWFVLVVDCPSTVLPSFDRAEHAHLSFLSCASMHFPRVNGPKAPPTAPHPSLQQAAKGSQQQKLRTLRNLSAEMVVWEAISRPSYVLRQESHTNSTLSRFHPTLVRHYSGLIRY